MGDVAETPKKMTRPKITLYFYDCAGDLRCEKKREIGVALRIKIRRVFCFNTTKH